MTAEEVLADGACLDLTRLEDSESLRLSASSFLFDELAVFTATAPLCS